MAQIPDEALRGEARETYDAFAPFYDRFTSDYDHAAWTRTLEEIAVNAGLQGCRLLDVACGTGKSFLPMLERGYRVTAFDVSPRMVALAAQKSGGRARVTVHDMRQFPRLGEFDLVWCLDDALNYVLEATDLVAAFTSIRDNLHEHGVLLFDVNSVRSYRSFFATLSVVSETDCVLVWDGETSDEFVSGDLALAKVEALERSHEGTWRRTEIGHRQRHHPESLIRSALDAAELRCVGVYGMQLDGSTHPGFDEMENSKAVYVCTRR